MADWQTPRIVIFGMRTPLSWIPLQHLLAAGIRPVLVCLPRTLRTAPELHPTTIPLLSPAAVTAADDLAQLLAHHQIPLLEIDRPDDPRVLQAIGALQPEVGLVSCFPHRLPAALRDLFPQGVVNLHPSLLPAYRGPDPLFWQLRQGETAGGVTLHSLDDGLDSGDIILQAPVRFEDGWAAADFDRVWGRIGGQLAEEYLRRLMSKPIASRPQPAGDSTFSFPTPADFALRLTWSARHAFNFMRGTAERGMPYSVAVAGQQLVVHTALDYVDQPAAPPVFQQRGRDIWLPFSRGVLHAR